MEHLLLRNAFTYNKRKAIDSPRGFLYNKQLGAWTEGQNGPLLVFHADYPKTGTKKFDVETGEDHKSQ